MTNYISNRVQHPDLIARNRDLLEASPRPGGYVRHLVPTRSQDYYASGGPNGSTLCACPTSRKKLDESKITKELFMKGSQMSTASSVYRLHPTSIHGSATYISPLDMTPSQLANTVPDEDWDVGIFSESDKEEYAIVTSAEDSVNMLAVTISLVMLLASDMKCIPEEYFIWAESYLGCIKDDKGNYPPNVQGLLAVIHATQGTLVKKASKTSSESPKKKRSKSKSKSKSSLTDSTRTSQDHTNVMTVEKFKPKSLPCPKRK